MTDNGEATASAPMRYPDVPVPGLGESPTPSTLRREIHDWISSEAFGELMTSEGGEPTGSLEAQLAYLDGFSAAAWDFRARARKRADTRYVERNQVSLDVVDGEREQIAVAAARALGLIEAHPPRLTSYDHILVLGGLVRANVWRSAYAAELLTSRRVTAPRVTGLTAARKLSPNPADRSLDEPSLLRAFGLPQRATEDEVMQDALQRAFSLPEPLSSSETVNGEVDGKRCWAASQAVSKELSVQMVVAAPEAEGGRRANTAETMQFWAGLEHVSPGDTILFVTSAIYVPFQHAVAVQNLGLQFGARVETVAVDHTVIEPVPEPQPFRGTNYLQELRSAVRAYRQLVEAMGTDDE